VDNQQPKRKKGIYVEKNAIDIYYLTSTNSSSPLKLPRRDQGPPKWCHEEL